MDVGFGLGPGQVWAACSSLAFDYSVWEIWVPCCMVHAWWWCLRQTTRSPQDLERWLLLRV
ncbi:hypothetical protein H7H51_31055 [Mycolicibacterium farcinogenes]|nr:hypothetical protein [Mycolicibacterium farcinogenes]